MEAFPVKCDVCENYFHSLEEKNDHLQRNHILINMNQRFVCDYFNCDASFTNKSSLRSHKSRRHRNRVPILNFNRNIVEPNDAMDVDDRNELIENLQGDDVDLESRNVSGEENSSNENDSEESVLKVR
ncbi:uncharacterized protein LOC127284283 [Leptopilina boulardi]|uniref:uncharacterized protein LOC127284283 n=1 Tax=Leptopilina boulardi TaxID=63433 RepID=UPI0021F524A5|nr:uncharacterized protein LOC127284283 [Leptopilina boulardi]